MCRRAAYKVADTIHKCIYIIKYLEKEKKDVDFTDFNESLRARGMQEKCGGS